MITYYIIQALNYGVTLKVGYRAKKFLKLEKKKGKLTDEQVKNIGAIIPATVDQIPTYAKHYNGRVTYELLQKEKTVFTQFNDAWFLFHEQYTGMAPKFNVVEGNALKQIIVYLTKVSGTEQEAIQVWQLVLNSWKQLDEFHQKNTDLKYINSNLNRILNNVKRINTQANGGVNNDYLEKIKNDLQS